MVALNTQEILEELKKLGVHNSAELNTYLKDYKAYYSVQKTQHAEKRSCERIPVGEDVKLVCRDRCYSGTVLNVSEKGMFIGTDELFMSNEVISIESKNLKVSARVKRLTKKDGYYDGIGVELSNTSRKFMKYIKKLKSPFKL